jgi:hypothetical protein
MLIGTVRLDLTITPVYLFELGLGGIGWIANPIGDGIASAFQSPVIQSGARFTTFNVRSTKWLGHEFANHFTTKRCARRTIPGIVINLLNDTTASQWLRITHVHRSGRGRTLIRREATGKDIRATLEGPLISITLGVAGVSSDSSRLSTHNHRTGRGSGSFGGSLGRSISRSSSGLLGGRRSTSGNCWCRSSLHSRCRSW